MKRMLLLIAAAATLGAQVRRGDVVDNAVAAVANLPVHALAPNDLIGISVYGTPELTRSLRLDQNGDIAIPMLPGRLHAAGLLPAELEEAIAAALIKAQVLVAPVVTVTILEYHARTVSVVGAVHKPITFPVLSRVRVLDALARAEGLTQDAAPEILLAMPANGDDAPEVRTIPVRELIDRANAAFNVELRGGEEIRVPEAGKVYIVGNVKRPGAYPVRDAGGMTILKILALSEGLTPFATKNAYIYRPGADANAREEVEIPLQSIIKRKQPDVALLPGDVFYIPDSSGRRNAAAALDRAAGFGASTASGLLIWRR